MKRCPICGKTYPDKLRFCTRCGTSLEAVEQSQEVPKQNANDLNQTENVNLGSNNREFYEKKTVSKRLSKLWGKLSLFSKAFAIICVIFVILFFVALILNKASACVIIVLAIVLAVVSFLMHKGVIRLKKAWISGTVLGLAVLLILPYAKALSTYTKGAERFEWDDIKLYRLIPETDSNLANISANTEKSLDMDVYKVSNGDYSDYIEECESFGFRYETVKSENSYEAYNKDGSSLSLHYDNKKKLLSIEVSVGEALGTLEWSDSEYASLIPIPSSDVGKVTQDNDSGFKVTVGDVTIDDYDEYVDLCIENGFDDGAVREDTEFSARNSAGNRLTVEYKGYKTMYIAVTQVEYEVKIKVDCHENYMFSKYDVKMYLDGEDLGEIKHGASKDVTLYLASGEYTLKFVQNDDTATEYLSDGEVVIKVTKSQTFAYEIRCTSTSIDIEKVDSKEEDESKEEQESEETTATKKTTTTKEATTTKETTTTPKTTTTPEPTTTTTTTKKTTTTTKKTTTTTKKTTTTTAEPEEEEDNSVSYYSKSKDTVKDGNTGVYAYRDEGGLYYNYYIIDFDEGYVYYFADGDGNTWCDKLKIDSGDLNSCVIVTYHDGDTSWQEGLHFKWVNVPDTLILELNGVQWDYHSTNLEKALEIRDEKNITEY